MKKFIGLLILGLASASVGLAQDSMKNENPAMKMEKKSEKKPTADRRPPARPSARATRPFRPPPTTTHPAAACRGKVFRACGWEIPCRGRDGS